MDVGTSRPAAARTIPTLQDVVGLIGAELEAVEEQLFELSRSKNLTLAAAVESTLSAGGKRLRPIVLLLAAKAASARDDGHEVSLRGKPVRLAVAIELIHTASLLHDDVIDEATTRRGRPSVNARWGNKVGVLAGDHLLASAVRIAVQDGTPSMIRGIADTAADMAEGQIAQSLVEPHGVMEEGQYLALIDGKTAILFACAARVGANATLGAPSFATALGEYGRQLGMAFQIADDVQDALGDLDEMGKPPGLDLLGQCWTLPYIRAHRVLPANDAEWLRERFERPGQAEEDLERIRALLLRSGAIQHSVMRARDYAEAARRRLADLPETAARRALADLTDIVTGSVARFA